MNKAVIGLEIHVELKTKSKMFCQCAADYFGKKPNTNTCPICLGMPGALPVPNKKAIEWTILIGKALNCTINTTSKFDRKHYFYPDLPKGYQISQYDEPIAVNGKMTLSKTGETFRIHRVHLEEDTGKLLHHGSDTLVDFNRSGVPLVEIVTEADFDNSDDVKNFLEELHTIIKYLNVSDADMDKGSMRMEPNISIRHDFLKLKADEFPPYKVEIKNINSFRYVKQAVDYELARQTELLDEGKIPPQETRGFDEKKVSTYSQRTKEEAHDYRYFPEPDIPPLTFSNSYLEKIESGMPILPQIRMTAYVEKYNIKPQDAFILSRNRKMADFFEQAITEKPDLAQKIANTLINRKIVVDDKISIKDFLNTIIEQSTPKQTDSALLSSTIETVISANKKVADDYKSGKKNAIMFLVGQVMKAMKGQADALLVKKEIEKKLQ